LRLSPHQTKDTQRKKEAKLVELTNIHDESFVTADSQKAEIVALTRQIETLKRQLVRVNDEARAKQEQRDAATTELSSPSP
jgi:hypothetical protein